MAAHEETLRLEGFSESLRGHRVYCVAKSQKFAETFVLSKIAALDAEVAHRGRKVFVFQGAAGVVPPRWTTSLAWDAAFHVRDVADLKLALTHIQHAGRPTRVFWMGQDPAAAVLVALGRMEGVTLVAVGDKPPTSADWHAVFWAPDVGFEDVELAVTQRIGSTSTQNLRAILKELGASEVGLVWSAIGEADKRGGLYWYDPQEGGDLKPAIDVGEAAEVLRKVADMLAGGGASSYKRI
jgi:hypothetical protein